MAEILNISGMPGSADLEEVDVCLLAEGCYPYVAGGVSAWIDWLMRSQPDLTFSILAIFPTPPAGPAKYEAPPNLRAVHHIYLDESNYGDGASWPRIAPEAMAELILRLLANGDPDDLRELISVIRRDGRSASFSALMDSPKAWDMVCNAYVRSMPHSAFLAYFWGWRALVGGLFRTLLCPLPAARLYHAVSTGYAGLLSARATLETGRPSILTEHGIYSNERRIEILMADWIEDSLDLGMDMSDDRQDIRDLWARAFESYARPCYALASDIVALYEANQQFQIPLGAEPSKMHVIANGIKTERFENLGARKSERPTIAFIGRVTPIKDVQAFIEAADILHKQFPDLRALIMGPMDEDEDYARQCVNAVQERGLEDVVEFTGPVDIAAYMPEVDVMLLTSISEALPLVILEAGAASIPCVTTDVGACREIIEGGKRERPRIGRGGMVAPAGDPKQIAVATAKLLSDETFRKECGMRLRNRVHALYTSEQIAAKYQALYARHLDDPVAEVG